MRYQAAIDAILARLGRDLPPNLHYHSIEHTLDVLERARQLAAAEGISDEEDLMLIQVAASYHDAGFLINNRDHERLGCKLVRQELPAYGFKDDQIKVICGMIRATKIPQQPRNLLEEIICDADLDYLGRDDFYPIGQRLYRELKAFRVLGTVEQWNKIQIKFLRAHAYWTTTNRRLREPLKQSRLRELIDEWGDPAEETPPA
ncbi:MAG: HD domain-containing protein [Bacteroidota bacterium]